MSAPGSSVADVKTLHRGDAVWIKTHPLHHWKEGEVLNVGRTRVLVRFMAKVVRFMAKGRVRIRERWFYAPEVRTATQSTGVLTAAVNPQLADGTCQHGLSGPCPECETPKELA